MAKIYYRSPDYKGPKKAYLPVTTTYKWLFRVSIIFNIIISILAVKGIL